MELVVANPRGFCAGVERAVEVVDDLLDIAPAPVYIRHAIVHNHEVVGRLSRKGAKFVEQTDEVPDGSVMVFSAHGVAPDVVEGARNRDLLLIDATCPLVTRVQLEVVRQAKAGRSLIIIGHRGHVEVEGLAGYFSGSGVLRIVEDEDEARRVDIPNPDEVAYVTQTTLAVSQAQSVVEVLRGRFPNLSDPRGDTICYATQTRQEAVRELAKQVDIVFVIGSAHSSNTNRMVEVAIEEGCPAHLIEDVHDIAPDLLAEVNYVGLTAGASAPENLVQDAIATLSQRYKGLVVRELGVPENVHFKAPATLQKLMKEKAMQEKTSTKQDTIEREGLASVIDTATDLAAQLRDVSVSAAKVAEREIAMVVSVAENSRDQLVSEKTLREARAMEVLRPLRESAHRGGDIVFDAAAVVLRVGVDAVEQYFTTPRGEKAVATPA